MWTKILTDIKTSPQTGIPGLLALLLALYVLIPQMWGEILDKQPPAPAVVEDGETVTTPVAQDPGLFTEKNGAIALLGLLGWGGIKGRDNQTSSERVRSGTGKPLVGT